MESILSNESYILLAMGIYVLMLTISYFLALRLDKRGVRTKATITSVETEEYDSSPSSESYEASYRYKAHIEFETKNKEWTRIKIPVNPKYLAEKDRANLRIIYPPGRPEKARVDDYLSIYVIPLVMLLLFLVVGISSAAIYLFV